MHVTGPTTQTQPKPEDQTQPPTGQAQEPAAPVEVLDPDEIEYRQALAAAEAEEAAGKPPAGQDPPTGDAPPQPGEKTPKDPQQPGPRPETPLIPKARLDEVAAQRDEAARQAAYWQGVAEGRQPAKPAPGEPGGQQAAPAPTTEQRLAEVRTSIKALATQFDNGEITMADLEEKRAVLIDREQAIREEALLAKVKPAPAAKDGSLLLDERTAELESQHPWVTVFDAVATPAEWGMVKALAVENLTGQGIDPTQGDRGSLALRAEVARLMDQIGPGLLTARATEKGVVIPGQQQQTQQPKPQQQPPGGKPPLSTEAAARAAKLALAAEAPPNLTSMTGSVIQRVTELTETERGKECVMQLVLDMQNDGVVGDNELTNNEER
jgi:hypothetical protein